MGKCFGRPYGRDRRLKNRKTQQVKEQHFMDLLYMYVNQGEKRSIIVKIFVYLGGIVFVSFQAYMQETNHCFHEFDCLTLPNSLFGGDCVDQSQNLTLPFPFFSQLLCGIRKLFGLSNFVPIFLAKVSFRLVNLDLGIITCFRNSLSFYQQQEFALQCFSKTSSTIYVNKILFCKNCNLKKNTKALAPLLPQRQKGEILFLLSLCQTICI